MSLEQAIEALTAAIQANTAALQAISAGSTKDSEATAKPEKASSAKAAAKPAPAAKSEPKRTRAEMQAAVNEVKERKGIKAAKGLIKRAGFDKLADVTEDKYEELYEAAKRELEADDGAEEDGL